MSTTTRTYTIRANPSQGIDTPSRWKAEIWWNGEWWRVDLFRWLDRARRWEMWAEDVDPDEIESALVYAPRTTPAIRRRMARKFRDEL